MLYEANYFSNAHGLRKQLNSSPINEMNTSSSSVFSSSSSSSSSSHEPSVSPITSNPHLLLHAAKKSKRSGTTQTVREVIESKLKRGHINTLIREAHSEIDWLNNSNEENLNHLQHQDNRSSFRKVVPKPNSTAQTTINANTNRILTNSSLPYMQNESDYSNYLDHQHHGILAEQQQQQYTPYRLSNVESQNDSVQNFSINNGRYKSIPLELIAFLNGEGPSLDPKIEKKVTHNDL